MSKKITTQDFINAATKVHSTYTYDNVVYTTSKTKVLITCPTHGDFLQTPNNHLSGKGCPQCSLDNRPTLSQCDVEKDVASICSSANTTNKPFKYCTAKSTFIELSCNDCSTEWVSSYATLKYKTVKCPSCNPNGFSTTKCGTLYIHSVSDSTGIVGYKIGITNRDAMVRFKEINRCSTFKHVMLFYFSSDGSTISELEKQIHKVCGTLNGLQTKMGDGFTEVIPPDTINQALDLVFTTINKETYNV